MLFTELCKKAPKSLQTLPPLQRSMADSQIWQTIYLVTQL